jgi:hypothetical protein
MRIHTNICNHVLSRLYVCQRLLAFCCCQFAGVACSNVFDGRRQFGCEDGSDSSSTQQGAASAADSHVLMGVTSQARVGLLTLFEWYRYVEVRHWHRLRNMNGTIGHNISDM